MIGGPLGELLKIFTNLDLQDPDPRPQYTAFLDIVEAAIIGDHHDLDSFKQGALYPRLRATTNSLSLDLQASEVWGEQLFQWDEMTRDLGDTCLMANASMSKCAKSEQAMSLC